jgi:hypothetical protein
MLDAVPDLRDELRKAMPEELADLLEAFDVTASYDKADHRLHLAETVPAELVSENETPTPKGDCRGFVHSGAGYEHLSPAAYRFTELRELA